MLVRILIIILCCFGLVGCKYQNKNNNYIYTDDIINKSFINVINKQTEDDKLYNKFKHSFKLYKGDDKRDKQSIEFTQIGIASWYGYPFHGQETASGEIYNMNKYTAAHKKLPLGSKIKVTNLKNKKSVIVTINDRGPYVKGRIIDLSKAAKEKIELSDLGRVRIEKI